jgi:CRISPR-associated protein Csh1
VKKVITAIRDIGEWIQRHQQKDALDVLIEPINPNNYRYAILLSIKGNEWNIELEENDPNTSSRYLYRKGSPNGINYSPTSMITELEKTFNIKFVAWFKKALEERKSENIKIESLIRPICELLDQEGEAILAKISDILKGIKDGAFLSLKIDGKYLKEIPQFVNLFLEMVNEKDMEISSYNQVCSVCGKQRELVVGGSSAFAFYTIDKPGFISGNFNANLSWRNHPVCMECNLLLQEGKRFVEENLRFSFYGLNYLLIPQFMYGKLELKDSIMRILEDEKKNKRLDSITINNTIASEEDILHYLKDESDQLVVHLLFMKKMNSAERILLLIQDVYPSHLRKIFEAKGHVEEQFTKYDGSIERYHFGRIRTFFQKSDEGKTSTDLDKYFLEIISAVFRGMKIDINFLITFFMKVIRSKYLSSKENDWEFQVSIRDALMNLLFFMRLGI